MQHAKTKVLGEESDDSDCEIVARLQWDGEEFYDPADPVQAARAAERQKHRIPAASAPSAPGSLVQDFALPGLGDYRESEDEDFHTDFGSGCEEAEDPSEAGDVETFQAINSVLAESLNVGRWTPQIPIPNPDGATWCWYYLAPGPGKDAAERLPVSHHAGPLPDSHHAEPLRDSHHTEPLRDSHHAEPSHDSYKAEPSHDSHKVEPLHPSHKVEPSHDAQVESKPVARALDQDFYEVRAERDGAHGTKASTGDQIKCEQEDASAGRFPVLRQRQQKQRGGGEEADDEENEDGEALASEEPAAKPKAKAKAKAKAKGKPGRPKAKGKPGRPKAKAAPKAKAKAKGRAKAAAKSKPQPKTKDNEAEGVAGEMANPPQKRKKLGNALVSNEEKKELKKSFSLLLCLLWLLVCFDFCA